MARSKLPISSDGAAVDAAVGRAAASWLNDTTICVALSGGVDSVVLLHALAALRPARQSRWRLAAHHVHHGLSPNADAWLRHCKALCASLQVPLTTDEVHVDRKSRTGIEAAARAARYESLDKVDAQIVALAHHSRDQAETVLLQLLRGAGAAGLAAMPGAAGRYVRPLLGVPKAAIAAYAASHALTWVDDESNADVRFARNRLRAQVWPALIAAFPSAEVTLSRAAAHQADAAVLLQELAAIDAENCATGEALQLSAFNALSQRRKANLLRYWLAKSGVAAPGTETLRDWLQQLSSNEPTQSICLRCADGINTVRVYRYAVWIVREVPRWYASAWHGEPTLILQGDHGLAGQVTSNRSREADALRLPLAGENWALRMREAGDAIELSTRSGSVAVKNLFQNAAIPPWQRERWPVLVCGTTVAAIVGIATANDFKVRAGEQGLQCGWKPA
jgi:tRNA(Ile)-lysidine synthase